MFCFELFVVCALQNSFRRLVWNLIDHLRHSILYSAVGIFTHSLKLHGVGLRDRSKNYPTTLISNKKTAFLRILGFPLPDIEGVQRQTD